jgi:hypothetical protein
VDDFLLIGIGLIIAACAVVWLAATLRSKLPDRTDAGKNRREHKTISGTGKDTQGNSSYYTMRKTAMKSKVEEMLVTPTYPIVKRKY